MASSIIVQSGQTLSELARQYHTSVAELVRLNHLKNANFIVAGQQLIVSDKPASSTAQQPRKQQSAAGSGHTQSASNLPVIEPTIQLQSSHSAGATAFIKDGRTFPNNNGYPVYAQGLNSATGTREDWARLPIGKSDISNIGCAMTSVAMAISGISGQAITPDEMNRFMNKIGGFNSDGGIQAWPRMGELVKPQVKVTRRFGVDANVIDKELREGRPVVVQVDYHDGRGKGAKSGYDGVGDHWILIVGRTPDNHYLVNDPAGGKMMTLHRMGDGRLEADSADNKYKTKYRTTGSGTTFDRGPGHQLVGVQAPPIKTTVSNGTSAPKTTSTTSTAKNTSTTTGASAATTFIKDGRTFPNNNGYPVYAQGLNSATGTREDWARLPISKSDISNIGCAMTSVAMAISGIGGQAITPDEMNRFMNKIGGFNSDGGIQAWPRMGELVKPQVKVTRRSGVDAKVIDQELEAGRPVVVQVDYHDGRGKGAKSGYDGVGDHWILIVGRTPDNRYLVNDPAGGKMMTLHRMGDGRLEADSADNKYKTKYRTTGNGTTFDRGPGAPSAGGVVVAAKNAASTAKTTTAHEPSTPKTNTTTPAKNTASKGSKAPADLLQAPPAVEEIIRKAAAKVGVDYGYMMAMAAQESSFRTSIPAKGKTSSAVGLYQFIKQSWLGMVKLHGAKHGLANHAARISYSKSDKKWVVDPPEKAQEILALRENGTYNALLAAEYAKENQSILTKKLGRSVGPTELYMAHFLGPGSAAKFLAARDAGKGNQSAADMFPDAAEANPSIFYSGTTLVVLKNERSLNEVYALMEKKIAPKADAYTIQLQDRSAETNKPVVAKPTEKQQPEVKPTTASTGVGATPKSASDFCFPFPKLPSQSWKTGARVFGALRSGGKRKHAGCDLYFPAGTWIHAVADGEVIKQPYNFYAGTQALEIRHGSIIVRYGEIQPNSFVGGTTVKKGQRLCKVGHLVGIKVDSDMLHIEMYAGTANGELTAKENKPYQRRKDLLDPTPFLDAWSANLPSSPASSS